MLIRRHSLAAALVLLLPDYAAASPALPLVSTGVAGTADVGRIAVATATSTAIEPMSTKTMRRFFSGSSRKHKDGRPVRLVLPPKGSPEMVWLCETILKMPEEVYRRFILARVFRGEIKKPLAATSPEHAKRLLTETAGAIAPLRVSLLGKELKEFPVSK